MYEFHQYNPALPQIITSFKGNQKLILGGYRYNIHHVKEGVKTWRCVCAKKLTGARSWCKGRAETWDNDSKGTPKGEHNHLTEHDLAELEYFKSQLIFAAIADPLADLNTLMDEASKFLSQGLSFGNRESMKKSLIVARKSAETGELKLGQQPHRSTLKGVRKSCVRSAKGSSGQHHQQSNGAMSVKVLAVKGAESTAITKARQSTPTTASSSLGHHGLTVSKASKQQQFNYPSSASASSLLLNSSSGSSSGLGSSLGDFSSSSITESPAGIHNWSQQLADLSAASGVSGLLDASAMANGSPAVSAGLGSNEQILAAALFAAAVLGTQTATSSSASGAAKRSSVNLSNSFNSSTSSAARTASPASTPGTANNNVKRKSARVNGILQKLSNKAAAESSVSPSPPLLLTGNSQMKQEPMEVENSSHLPMVEQNRMMMVSVETQTDMAEEWKTADTTGIRKRRHGSTSAEAEKESAPSEEADEDAFGKLNGHHCCQRKVICCCCSDDEAEVKAEEIPLGCRKRAKLLMKVTKREVEEEEKHEGHEEEVEEEEKEEQSSQQSGSKEELAEQQHLELELFELEEEELKLEIVDEDDDEEEEEPEEKDENNHHSQ